MRGKGCVCLGERDASSAYVWGEGTRAETYADDARTKAYDCIIAYRLYHAIDMIRLYHAYIAYPDACADTIVSCIRLYHAYMYSDACADACRSISS